MSNNIYDILKKIESLEAPKKTNLTESKMTTVKELHNESKKEKQTRKGTIAEAVAQVEQQLNEKYMGFKKTVAAIKKGGSAENPEAVAASIGRKKYGKEKFQKAAAAGKKLGEENTLMQKIEQGGRDIEGFLSSPLEHHKWKYRERQPQPGEYGYPEERPITNPYYNQGTADDPRKIQDPRTMYTDTSGVKYDKEGNPSLKKGEDPFKKAMKEGEVEESGLQAYLGKKKYGKTGMKALQKAGREGASKEKMALLRAKHDKMDEDVGQEGPADLLAAVEQEINNPGRSIDNLTDVLNATFGSDRSPEFKKARAVIGKYLDLVDNAAMGSEQDGIAPMRGGNIARHIQQYDLTDYLQHAAAMLDKAVKGPLDEGNYNEEMLSPKQKSFAALAEPKDKITYADKIAGAKKGKKTEGNKFSGNLMKARAQGLKQADLDGDGDMEKVTPGKSMREGWEEMQKYLDKKRGPESKGGAGKKAGTRYGGSAQKDDDEDTDGEGKPVEKKKGRPKGTGGGAKFSFKKPKD